MRFYFSPRRTAIGLLLAAFMLGMSYWQWTRHLEKKERIAMLEARLREAPLPLEELLIRYAGPDGQQPDVDALMFRRVIVAGTFDFEHEVVLRNRRQKELPGVHILTPLRTPALGEAVLINRGFIPLSAAQPETRGQFRKAADVTLVGLVKGAQQPSLLAPKDPSAGPGRPWVDAWLRPDLAAIQKQLPYPLAPFYLEAIGAATPETLMGEIVKSESGQSELLLLGAHSLPTPQEEVDLSRFPVPAVDTFIPPGRHLGYVFEWAAMAAGTLLITVLLQLRRPRDG